MSDNAAKIRSILNEHGRLSKDADALAETPTSTRPA